MGRNGASIDEMKNEDIESLRNRASAVRNAMATSLDVLDRIDTSLEMKDGARARINAHFELLAGRTTTSEDRLNFMRAVDQAAEFAQRAEAEGRAGEDPGRAVLECLAPELRTRFAGHVDDLGNVLFAWRVRSPGRRGRSKWAKFADVWNKATGEETTASAWKQAWKGYKSPIAAAIKGATKRAEAANRARENLAHGPTEWRQAVFKGCGLSVLFDVATLRIVIVANKPPSGAR
jgi:hypothetical protein